VPPVVDDNGAFAFALMLTLTLMTPPAPYGFEYGAAALEGVQVGYGGCRGGEVVKVGTVVVVPAPPGLGEGEAEEGIEEVEGNL
jgi:hypothetical protein